MGLFDKTSGRLWPIWRHSSTLLAVETTTVATPAPAADAGPYRAPSDPIAERERRITAIVYTGQREVAGGHMFVLRRIELDAVGRVRLAWETGAPEPGVLVPQRYGRVRDVIVVPGGVGGVRGVDLRTGEQRWFYMYEAPIGAPPELLEDGSLLVRFVDGFWCFLDVGAGFRRFGDPTDPPRPPAGRQLIDVRGLDDAPVPDRLTWLSMPGGQDALGVLEPSGTTRWVLVVDTGAAVCRFDGCYAVDGLLAVRVSILEPGATIGRRSTYLCDPRTWRVLARLPGADATTSELYSPRWMGRL